MERYHAFPNTGDGDTYPALDVSRNMVYSYAMIYGKDPRSFTVMRKDETGQVGTWVKFDDALKRSRHEYDEGYKARSQEVSAYIAILQNELSTQYEKGLDAGLKQGRKEGQVKTDAISEISAAQLAQEYERGHTAAFNSKLGELIDSHKSEATYQAELSDAHSELYEAEAVIDDVVALLREYQDVQVEGIRGIELAEKLTAFVNENG